MERNAIVDSQYREWLTDLKQRFRQAQLTAAVRVNSALLQFYWELGADIVEKQKTAVWGSGFLKHLCADLSTEFPDVTGFSYRNVKFIRQWYLFYSEGLAQGKQPVSQLPDENGSAVGKQPVSHMEHADLADIASLLVQIPWGHNIRIVQKCSTVEHALFYVRQTIENGWSRAILAAQIESGLHERQGAAITNFEQTLPAPQSELAMQTLKDPYIFDFLSLSKKADAERGYRNREGKTLFIDARKIGSMISRTQKELDTDDIAKIAETYHAWRTGSDGAPAPSSSNVQQQSAAGAAPLPAYDDVPGYCKSASLDEIRKHDYVLTPGRYVGAADIEDDGIPFETKMTEMSQTLYAQMEESAKLDEVIRKNLEGLGYGE